MWIYIFCEPRSNTLKNWSLKWTGNTVNCRYSCVNTTLFITVPCFQTVEVNISPTLLTSNVTWHIVKLNSDKIWKIQNANDDSLTVYIVRTRTYCKSPLFWLVHFLQSDWLIGWKWRLLIGQIGRGRRREHPNQRFVLLLLRKKYGKTNYGGKNYGGKKVGKKTTKKKYGEKKYGEKYKGKRYGKKNTWKKIQGKKYGKKIDGKKVRGKNWGKKSRGFRTGHLPVPSGQACAMVRSSGSFANNKWKPLIYYSRSGFPYYKPTTPTESVPLYPPPGDAVNSSVGLNHGSLHQYTCNIWNKSAFATVKSQLTPGTLKYNTDLH